MHLLHLALLLASVLASSDSTAAEFTLMEQKNVFCDKLKGERDCLAISMTGTLTFGDTERFKSLVSNIERLAAEYRQRVRIGTVFLDSTGGDVNEAMKLGRTMRSLQIASVVPLNSRCASACVLVLAAGVTRVAMGSIEVHSFYAPSLLGSGEFEKGEAFYRDLSGRVSTYLKDMRISTALLDEMIRIPHNQSRKLEWEEVKKLSLVGVDPVYAQTRPQTSRTPK
jgi:hypothetical protein